MAIEKGVIQCAKHNIDLKVDADNQIYCYECEYQKALDYIKGEV